MARVDNRDWYLESKHFTDTYPAAFVILALFIMPPLTILP
jgi:hypothetical protein